MPIEMTDEALPIESMPMREDFGAFYTRERRAVLGLAYVLSGSRSGAEDLARRPSSLLSADGTRSRNTTIPVPGYGGSQPTRRHHGYDDVLPRRELSFE